MKEDLPRLDYKRQGDLIRIRGQINKLTVSRLYKRLIRESEFKELYFLENSDFDSAGIALLYYFCQNYPKIKISGLESAAEEKLNKCLEQGLEETPEFTNTDFLEKIYLSLSSRIKEVGFFLLFLSDVFFFSLVGIVSRKQRRRGSILKQTYIMGSKAFLLIVVMSFFVGLIIALQGALQFQRLGGGFLLAPLITLIMLREGSAALTAVILAGRSGSAIASEVATMKVFNELDALQLMAINPLRYVVVPRLLALCLVSPLLAAASFSASMFGGFLVSQFVLELQPVIYFEGLTNSINLEDIILLFVKSLAFSVSTAAISSWLGLKAKNGAEDVGRATTQAVVYSIAAVILLDIFFVPLYGNL